MITINLSAAGAKEAVARLREFLAANGISLKQTHAYEALAQTLGYANWNTLQALLNATPSPENEASSAATVPADKQTARIGEAGAVAKGLGVRLSPSLEQSLHRAIGLATERHHEHAALEHLLLSLTEDQDAASVFLAVNVNMEHLRKALTDHIDNKLHHLATTEPVTAKPTTGFQRVVQRAVLHVQNSAGGEVTGVNVLLALFSEPESHAVNDLKRQGVTKLGVVNYIANSRPKPLNSGQ